MVEVERSSLFHLGEACSLVCIATLVAFGFMGGWVALTQHLPLAIVILWFFGGVVLLLVVPVSLTWGLYSTLRYREMRGMGAVLAAVAAPASFVYGILSATAAP